MQKSQLGLEESMRTTVMRLCALLLFLCVTAAFAQNPPEIPAIVQPGAPGQPSKILTTATLPAASPTLTPADISFMQGMIMHHAQAVEMTDLMRTRSRNKALLELGNRISISQTDEIKFMKQWLEDRGQSTTMNHQMSPMPGMQGMNMKGMGDVKGMDMKGMDMDSMPLMPGMLTPEQMKALAKATGPAFDRLFLTGMIQHHGGALTMVEDLFNTPGAGQDPVLFDFATDVTNTQRAEIAIMQRMLKEKK